MGAIDFQCISEGRNVQEAFLSAVEDAYYWHGHSGYTGTICEKPGYVLLDLGRKLSVDEAEEIANELNFSWQIPTPRLIELIGDESKASEFANLFHDKWNDAIAIQVDDNSWYFCGLASE